MINRDRQRVKLTPFLRDMGFTKQTLIGLVEMLTPNRSGPGAPGSVVWYLGLGVAFSSL